MKINKKRKKTIYAFSCLVLGLFFFLSTAAPTLATAPQTFNYTPMEQIPGYGAPSDFFDYIAVLYRFGIGAVGIAALIMLAIGGFMYITSAGNNASMEKAKGVITDAIVGLLLAVSAYILLYTINPDLVKLKRPVPAQVPLPSAVAPPAGAPGVTGPPPGVDATLYPCANSVTDPSCRPPQNGACAPSNFVGTCLENSRYAASVICQKESSGIASIASGVDKCQPGGESVSYGLFQINLTANNVAGLNCTGSVGPLYTAQNHFCSITNPTVFNQCVAAARNPTINIQAACSISGGGTNWSPWGASSGPSGCRC